MSTVREQLRGELVQCAVAVVVEEPLEVDLGINVQFSAFAEMVDLKIRRLDLPRQEMHVRVVEPPAPV